MMVPCFFAACIASRATAGVGCESAEEMRPGWKERALAAEYLLPVDVAGLELRGGRVPSVRTAQCGAHAEASLGEVQAVAHPAPDAVVLAPEDVRLIDAALLDEVLHQTPDGVVREQIGRAS